VFLDPGETSGFVGDRSDFGPAVGDVFEIWPDAILFFVVHQDFIVPVFGDVFHKLPI